LIAYNGGWLLPSLKAKAITNWKRVQHCHSFLSNPMTNRRLVGIARSIPDASILRTTISGNALSQRYDGIAPYLITFVANMKKDDEPLVAVKRLHSPDETEFKKEETILKALSSQNHPHLINLLATFEHKKKYHLLFPYADSNLRKYWEDRPHPSFDEPTVMWSLEQMVGIASALLLIHNFRVTYPLLPSDPGKVQLPKDTKLSVGPPGEELYGRHGDIKPENILWFKRVQGPDGQGVLQIADFGLGRFHGRDSRSGISPSKVVSSPTYEPPECKLHKPVSRSYDIWSLGCLFLEFVTWLLKGSAEINGFADFRGRLSSIGINEDNFFTVTNNGSEAVVREKVTEWVNQLHEHKKCSELIHDLLELTMSKLLVVDSKDRASAKEIFQQLEKYLQKAKSDKQYLLAPVPPPEQAPLAPDPPESHSRKSVTFSNQGNDITPIKRTSSPRNLVLRNIGTPGFLSRHSGT
jgi:serine/threonine protein kinase